MMIKKSILGLFKTAFAAVLFTGTAGVATAQQDRAAITAFVPFENSIPAENLTAASVGRNVSIYGSVLEVIPSTNERTPTRLVVVKRDAAPVQVIFWPDFHPNLPNGDPNIPVGTPLGVRGEVSDYRGTLQIRVRDKGNIRFAGLPGTEAIPAVPRPPITIVSPTGGPTPDAEGYYPVSSSPQFEPLLGKTVTVKGTVAQFTPAWNERAPNVVALADAPGKLEVVYWTTEGTQTPSFADAVGKTFYATGEVGVHQGRLQVRVRNIENMSLTPIPPVRLAPPAASPAAGTTQRARDGWPGRTTEPIPAPPAISAERPTPIRNISRNHEGQKAMIAGAVSIVFDRNEGKAAIIGDRTGQIVVDLTGLPADKAPAEGSTVSATGTVVFNATRSAPELKIEKIEPLPAPASN